MLLELFHCVRFQSAGLVQTGTCGGSNPPSNSDWRRFKELVLIGGEQLRREERVRGVKDKKRMKVDLGG